MTSISLADTFIMLDDDIYYAYGTNACEWIEVYISNDLNEWEKTPELALHKSDLYGEKWFWTPEVYYVNDHFFMYYSAEEHILVVVSDSPLGTFRQELKRSILEGEKTIDNSLFIDDDGKPYFFWLFKWWIKYLGCEIRRWSDYHQNVNNAYLYLCVA